ncbi:hypothetical protein [Mycobacteroides abscessus]|uniref:hypothetical protein n=1 Tax=Mycobacteroides abscessus TaxID=36809 RepID=UPI00148F70D0|nr:hypothetical protein [Mycobacteroides abscessus]
MTYTDPDFGIIYDRAAKAGSSARINDTSGQVSATSSKVAGATDGGGPEKLTGDAVTIGQTLSALATDAAIAKHIWDDLKRAADAWKAAAPKADVMDAAEKAVTDAQAASTTANEKADAAPDDENLQKAADDAGAALVKAKQALIDLQRKRKAANKALLEAISRAIGKAKRMTGSRTQHGTGKEMPNTGSGTGSGTGSPAARTGSGTPAAKPAGAPAATPSAEKPTTSTSSANSSGIDPATLAAAAALTQQNQQPQQAAQQPTAQMPTMPTVPQQANQQQNKGATAEKPLGDKLAEAALGETPSAVLASLGNIPSPSSSTPSTSPPAVQQHVTELRPPGTPIAGTNLGGTPAVNTQVSHTTGNSATGLTTQSDVAGRPQGTENKPFTPAPGTSTSGAHGTGTAPGQGTQQQTTGARPMGGMPMMPGMMGAPAAAAPASRQGGDGERTRGVASTSDPLGLLVERGDAVDGGTIAQNRDKPAA